MAVPTVADERVNFIRKLLKPKAARPKSNPSRPKKKVRWNPVVLLKKVPSTLNMRGVEASDLWYTSKDYYRMRMHDKIVVLMKNQGKLLPDDPVYCFRGLEARSFVVGREKIRARFLGVLTVLLEQDRQHVEYDSDLDLLADRYYNNVSYDSHMEALQRGLDDEQDALQVYREWDDCPNLSASTSEEDDDTVSISSCEGSPIPIHKTIPVSHSSTYLAAQAIAMWELTSSPRGRDHQ